MPSRVSPLSESYPTKVLMVLLALCPYIIVTTAATLMQQPMLRDLHTSKTALEMTSGLANAGYAFGAVLAALMHITLWQGKKPPQLVHGISVGGWILVAILGVGLAISVFIWRASGARSHAPDMDNWLEEGNEALDSPPILAEVR